MVAKVGAQRRLDGSRRRRPLGPQQQLEGQDGLKPAPVSCQVKRHSRPGLGAKVAVERKVAWKSPSAHRTTKYIVTLAVDAETSASRSTLRYAST